MKASTCYFNILVILVGLSPAYLISSVRPIAFFFYLWKLFRWRAWLARDPIRSVTSVRVSPKKRKIGNGEI